MQSSTLFSISILKPKNLFRIFGIHYSSFAICLFTSALCLLASYMSAQGTWTQKANYATSERNKAAGFPIGNMGYIGTGGNMAGGPTQELWQWDQASDAWTQKANFSGGVRVLAVAFSIGAKGYLGTGNDGTTTNYSDFWEYDPIANNWTQKANFGGGIREWAVGFSIGTKGYIGTGWDGTAYQQDFWEYDPIGNTWTPKASFSGGGRAGAVGFSIGTKGYIGTGNMNSTYYQDFWEYDPTGDTWTPKMSMLGLPRSLAAGFSIGTKGYIGTGTDGSVSIADLWEWDQALDAWNPVAPFPGIGRTYAVGLAIGNRGYIGTGFYSAPLQDFWEFLPQLTANISSSNNVTCPGASNGNATAVASGGLPPYNFLWCDGQIGANAIGLSGNTYTVIVTDAAQSTASAVVTITEPPAISIYSIPSYVNPATCGNSDGSVNYVIQGGTSPYNYLWSNGQTTQTITGLSAGSYRMNVTDAIGCFSFFDALVANSNGPSVSIAGYTNVSCYGLSDGSISISVSGGNPPYTFYWSNGATTQNISGLTAGPYEVDVKDASGCLSPVSVEVFQPSLLDAYTSVVNSSCWNANGTAKVFVGGGTSPYTYQWSTGETPDSIFFLPANSYTVRVTDANNCTVTGWAIISDSISPSILLDSVVAVDCGSNGGAYITPSDPLSIQSYLWTNGWTTQNLSGVAAGGYGCTVTDTSGCKNSWFVKVPPVMPPLKPICLVTVDTTSNMNIVVWEKPAGATYISRFNVYRESSMQGIYQLIGFSPWANLSVFYDSVPDPDNRWAKYKVSMVDVCGNEGALSAEHKTIHLAVPAVTAQGVNLIWDDYDGYAFSYYRIFRKANSNGTWLMIDSVPANVTTYIDGTYNPLDTNYYHVDAPPPSGGCAPSLKDPEPMVTNLNTSRSNIYRVVDTTFVSVNSAEENFSISIYPNPSTGIFTIQSSEKNIAAVTIFNILGEEVRSVSNLKSQISSLSIDLRSYAKGLYNVQLILQDKIVNKKLLIE